MTILTRYALIAGAAALLAGCGGSQLPIGMPGAMPQSGSAIKQTTSGGLLYAVTTGNKYVYVMTYPAIKLLHQLGPFTKGGPLSLCADSANGDVYVLDPGPNYTGGKVYIYKHGSTGSTRMLQLPNAAWNCAVDPASADLAVLTHGGQLAIYRHSRGAPHMYMFSNGGGEQSIAYGAGSNLYVAGASGRGWLARVIKGQLQGYNLYDRIVTNGIRLQWYRGRLIATTLATSWPRNYHQYVYAIKLEASHQTKMQIVTLRRKEIEKPNKSTVSWVQDGTLIAPDHSVGSLDFWTYPQGGEPERSAQLKSADGYFTGIVVSPAS